LSGAVSRGGDYRVISTRVGSEGTGSSADRPGRREEFMFLVEHDREHRGAVSFEEESLRQEFVVGGVGDVLVIDESGVDDLRDGEVLDGVATDVPYHHTGEAIFSVKRVAGSRDLESVNDNTSALLIARASALDSTNVADLLCGAFHFALDGDLNSPGVVLITVSVLPGGRTFSAHDINLSAGPAERLIPGGTFGTFLLLFGLYSASLEVEVLSEDNRSVASASARGGLGKAECSEKR